MAAPRRRSRWGGDVIPTSLGDLATAVSGTVVPAHAAAAVVTHVCSDSREVQAGSLFVALTGDPSGTSLSHLGLP